MAEDVSMDVQPDLPTRNVTSRVEIHPLFQPPLLTYGKKGMADDLDTDQDPPMQRTNPLGEKVYREVGMPWEYTRYIEDFALAAELLGAAGAAFATAILTTAGVALPADMPTFLLQVKAQTGCDTFASIDAATVYLEGKLKADATMPDGRKYRDVVRTATSEASRALLIKAGIPV